MKTWKEHEQAQLPSQLGNEQQSLDTPSSDLKPVDLRFSSHDGHELRVLTKKNEITDTSGWREFPP